MNASDLWVRVNYSLYHIIPCWLSIKALVSIHLNVLFCMPQLQIWIFHWRVHSWLDLWTLNSSYYSWACSSAVFTWKRGIWVIVLRRKCLCIKYSNVSAIFRTSDSFYRRWGIAQPMDAPTEVTRWDGRTYRGISIALSIAFVIWQGQAPLNIWTCSSSEKYVFGGMLPHTI